MSTVYGLANYSNLFSSPVNTNQVNPLSNLIYGSAVSKFYSQTVGKQVKSVMSSYLSSLNSSVGDIKSASKQFTSSVATSSFTQKSVTSSDSSSISGTAAYNADMKNYTLNVSKLATAQTNNGSAVNSNDKSTFNTGSNTFSLKVGGNQKNITFNIDENDTNKSGLQKMASAINYSKAGVTATVASDAKTGTSYIKLTADKTGTDNTFSLNDVTGNAVSASGAASVSTQAQNAEYTLDGKQYSSQSNTISADNDKVKFTLNKANGKDIKLTVNSDNTAIKSDISDLVNSYNNMINLAATSSSTFSGADKLKSELTSIVQSKKSSLASIGITQNSDGTLAIDKTKLESSLNNNLGSVKDILGGSDGFAQKLYSKANDVLTSPTKYSKLQDSFSGSTSNTSNAPYANNYQSRQNLYLGLVVDSFL